MIAAPAPAPGVTLAFVPARTRRRGTLIAPEAGVGALAYYPRRFANYDLLSSLVQSKMSELFLALHGAFSFERLVVVKTVVPQRADAEYVARFRHEAKVGVKLSHGNVVPVFEAGLADGNLFLAMDFVEGRNLRAVWNRCARQQVAFPVEIAAYIVKELGRGLAYVHAAGDLHVIHGDVSPANVMVSAAGEVRLIDFGLASSRLQRERPAPGFVLGKIAYLSPEQARGEDLDGRTDQYTLGILLWELLTGRQLFPPGPDARQDLLMRAAGPEVMRPSRRAPRVPSGLDEICLTALAPDRSERYHDCAALEAALQAWLAKHTPATGARQMASLMRELFGDDLARDRAERAELLTRYARSR